MSPAPDRKQARGWIEAQITELGSLRNASTRDSGFKTWRQHTLTLIQRTWTDDASKAQRFKRIPFTSTETKPDRDQVRVAYEKGCAEALSCLRAFLAELDAEKTARPGRTPGPGVTPKASPEPAPRAPAPEPRPREPLRLEHGVPEPTFDPTAKHGAKKLAPTPTAVRHQDAPPASMTNELARHEARDLPASKFTQHDDVELSQDEDGELSQPDEQEVPEATPPRAADPGAGNEHEVVRRAMADYLDSSPVFAAMTRSMERERGTEPRLSPSALALAALASELADLGVPPPSRAPVRDALDELAKHIDRRDLTWDELRMAIAVVMEFRGVARRVLPLLLPFLDEAA